MYRITTRLAVGLAFPSFDEISGEKRESSADQSTNPKAGQNKMFGSHHVTKLQHSQFCLFNFGFLGLGFKNYIKIPQTIPDHDI